MSTFVSFGNLKKPFPRLSEAIENLARDDMLPQPILMQTGHTNVISERCTVISFLTVPEFEDAVSEASLVIMQAGGGGVLTAIQNGKVPILCPRQAALGEHVDDHQSANARNLARLGLAVVAMDQSEFRSAIPRAFELQRARDTARSSPVPVLAAIRRDLADIAIGRSLR